MKKYILIQNDGEIESNSFELIGASTKRGESGKIGFFGSGLKYSIAYMMRNSIDFKIFSGELEIKFTTIKEQLKGKEFERICINGKPSSYTVSMGPTWTEDWYILREIYCNALDESNCLMVRETESINSVSGKTRIYIELTDKLKNVIHNWDQYFSIDREPLFIAHNTYTSFLAQNDSNERSQSVMVYNKTAGVIYRRGVNVYKNDRYLFDYSVEYADINEDRTAKNSNAMTYAVVNMLAAFNNEHYVKSVLRTGLDDISCYEYVSMTHTKPEPASFSMEWVAFSEDNLLVVKEISGKFSDQVARSTQEVFYIPAYFARELKRVIPSVSILGMGRAIGNVGMCEVERTTKMDFLLKEVLNSLKEMKYVVPYDIEVVAFDDEDVLGQADTKTKTIYLSDRVFDMGRREIAMTLIEETEHIYSGKPDESRSFQTHLISSWLKSMEEANGLFL